MFWGPAGLDIAKPGFFMIVFVHMTFTFPYVVRPIAATIKTVNIGHEEASATFRIPRDVVWNITNQWVVCPWH